MRGMTTGSRYFGCFGTVRYIGEIRGRRGSFIGIEFDRPSPSYTDGCFGDYRYFECPPNSGGIVPEGEFQKVCYIHKVIQM